MNSANSIMFQIKAKIGELLVESVLKKMGNELGASTRKHTGEIDIEWISIDAGKDETMMFLHGFSARKETFLECSKNLVKNFNIIIPDMPGFGNSTVSYELVYNFENYCRWLGDFLEHNGFDKFHLVGNSMGGAVALLLAEKYPEKIESLSLVGSAGFYLPDKKSIYDDALEGHNIFSIQSAEDYEYFRDRVFNKKPVLPIFAKEYVMKNMMDNRDWYNKVFHDFVELDSIKKNKKSIDDIVLDSLCGRIQMPTNILWGKHDTLFPYETAYHIKMQIPNSKVHIFDELGHAPYMEDSKLFAKVLSEHLLAISG
jgi:abhydrolase domain-containing protein 6